MVDTIVSEPIGVFLFHERMVSNYKVRMCMDTVIHTLF